jgi:uncharacterized protein with GYD domain
VVPVPVVDRASGLSVVDFPDDETAAEYALTIGKAGNAETELQ